MSYSFISVEELKAYPLPVTDKQWEKVTDEQVEKVIAYASEHIADYIDRDIHADEYTERRQGNDRPRMVLNSYPVTELLSVTAVDEFGNVTEFSPGEFLVDEDAGIIEWLDRSRNRFWKGQFYEVEYAAGFSEIPGPVKHATALQTIQMLQPLFRGGANFVQVDLVDESNEQIVDLLEKYKRKRIG